MQDKTYINRCEKDMDPDQEIIAVNKSKLIDDISTLLAIVFIFGVMFGAILTQLIIRFS